MSIGSTDINVSAIALSSYPGKADRPTPAFSLDAQETAEVPASADLDRCLHGVEKL